MKRTITTLTLLTCAVSWGCAPAGSVDDRYHAQLQLVHDMIARLEINARSERDRQFLQQLQQLHAEIEKTRERHRRDAGKIAHLEEELARLRVAETFRVNHLDVLFHTRATTTGIALWAAPRDRQNDAVKAAGAFTITLHRPGLLGMGTLGKKLCEWKLSAEDVKGRWEGHVYRGYHLELSWPDGKRPDIETAVLHVAFTTTRDQIFTASKEIHIRE